MWQRLCALKVSGLLLLQSIHNIMTLNILFHTSIVNITNSYILTLVAITNKHSISLRHSNIIAPRNRSHPDLHAYDTDHTCKERQPATKQVSKEVLHTSCVGYVSV